jgi:SpoVK/Ycf46/Vps4 family AAA+-type ATPase
MKPIVRTDAIAEAPTAWRQANHAYLELQLRRLRLLIQRRILWLRSRWRHDPLQSYQGMVISEEQADMLLAGEDRRAEARFHQENPPAVALSAALTRLTDKLAARRAGWEAAGITPALETLAGLFALNPFERETLLLCLAPELDPTFERLYAYVQDDVTRKYATPQLAITLFANEGPSSERDSNRTHSWAAHDRLGPEAPLRRWRLVQLEPSPTPAGSALACPLHLDERMVDYLRGINRLDPRLAPLLRPVEPALLAPAHQEVVDRLARSMHGPAPDQRPPVNLVGPRSAGKRAVAHALCDALGLSLYRLEAGQLSMPAADRHDLLRLLERDLLLLHAALYVDGTEARGADSEARDATGDVIEGLGAFFVVGSKHPWPTVRPLAVASLPRADAGSQKLLWHQALAGLPHSLNGHIDALVEQFDLGPAAMARAVAAARDEIARTLGSDAEITADHLWQACRGVASQALDDLAERVTPCYTWDDIVLPEDASCQLREIAAQVAHRFHVYETWGFGTKLSRGRGLSALFAGPSGTGKTMAAEILAHHLHLDLYRIDLAGVVSKYIGETEKNLRKVFDAAEQGGAILFFDEADALFGKRTEVKDSHDRYANIEVNYLLQRMEGYRGLAILATNRKAALDRAFLRRLRFLVDFPSPDAPSRRAIWEKVFPAEAAVDALDLDALARLEIAGGNIRNIAINAAFLAADDAASIAMTHIMRAARREYAKIDKMFTTAEFGRYHQEVTV